MDYVTDTVRTLNNLSDLRETRFGRPPPRHGLNLLWWFANDCVQIDFNGRMTAKCNPTNGAFGFHLFHNRDGLIPYSDLLYHEVGNLSTTDSLPDYVTEHYTGYSDNSNMDRIIASFDPRRRRFENIYVTQHSDQVNFDQNHTYRISAELIKDIQDLNRKEFLSGRMTRSEHVSVGIYQPWQTNTRPSISTELIQDIQDLSWEDFLREYTNNSEHVSIDIHKSAQTNSCQSISTELIQDIQDLSWEDFLREHTNNSEHVSIDIHKSAQTNSCQSISTELIQDIQDLSREDFLREHSDPSIDIPQSVQHNQTKICQRENCCWALLCCSLLILLLVIAATVYLLLKMEI